jgi:hypothetical protein
MCDITPSKALGEAPVLFVWQPLPIRIERVAVPRKHLDGDVVGAGLVLFVDTAQYGVGIAPRRRLRRSGDRCRR